MVAVVERKLHTPAGRALAPSKSTSIFPTLNLFGEESDGEILKGPQPWLKAVLLVWSKEEMS